MVVSRNLEVGRIFAAQFAPDPEVAFRLSVAGSKGRLQVWDISTNANVRKAFVGRAQLPESSGKERFVHASLSDHESDEEEKEDIENGRRAGGVGVHGRGLNLGTEPSSDAISQLRALV